LADRVIAVLKLATAAAAIRRLTPVKRLHVLFVVTNYPPHQGGVEQHVAALARELTRQGMQASVVCLGDEPGVRQDGDVSVHTVRRRLDVADVLALPGPGDWMLFARELAETVTHISTHTRFFPMSMLGVRLGRRAGLPVIHTEHGADFVTTPSWIINLGARQVDRSAGVWVLRQATEVLSVSRRVSEFVSRLSGRPSAVIGNGVHLEEWLPPEPPAAASRLVFVGRVVEEKGWRVFLDVVESLQDIPNLEAVVAGDGPQRGELAQEVRRRGLEGTVRLPGSVDHTMLAAYFRGAVYVNPSTAAEGFQLTLLESLAAGARVVTYDVGVAGELRDSGMPVSMVALKDRLALESAAREELFHPSPPASHTSLRSWDWSCVADRYIEVLRTTS
jgi:glycosyltransferase involved in cell wall biosynthesis